MANVPLKFLLKMSDNIVCGDDNAKKGTQLSVIEESYINKESEKQLRSRYDQFISSKDVADFAIICNAVVLWFSSYQLPLMQHETLILVSFFEVSKL